MKSNYLLLLVFVFSLFACKTEVKKEIEPSKESVAVVAEKTLYEKLGGAEGISSIVDDIIEVHLKNDNIKQFFVPLTKDPEYLKQFKQHVKDFFGSGTGGPEEYKGRDIPSAHQGLNISEAEFLHAIDDILLVLDSHKIDRNSRNEVLAVLFSLKWDVIKK
ncbi:group I truncated hemoglobin [Tenacibaculum caenipelagi]|uniref:Hemoglobin n=1 Tax=Tenacibaculum caenipelagi TaxID=1325435 RepID=A0A4R6TGK1_9FLAO|nr:group 1 truncated hemoglobin [Tenacibaculum caenipelagi]TDQ27849.1 hemoglobin [Tenacibaculum caenipelagi]